MDAKLNKFPHIGPFDDVIRMVRKWNSSHHELHRPVIADIHYRGTVKLHGTNCAVTISRDSVGHEITTQSRKLLS